MDLNKLVTRVYDDQHDEIQIGKVDALFYKVTHFPNFFQYSRIAQVTYRYAIEESMTMVEVMAASIFIMAKVRTYVPMEECQT